jgi:hypothetical protein
LETFESFKTAEKEKYLRKYYARRWFRRKEYLDYAKEIEQLVIKKVYFPSRDHPNHAEVNCCAIPGSWRYWWCGYVDSRFYNLWY